MPLTTLARSISAQLSLHSQTLKSKLSQAFENATVGCAKEILFLDKLITELERSFNGLSLPGIDSLTRKTLKIHQKPIVTFPSGRCELGDLLVVIKYHGLNGELETKSIIYQVKMASGKSTDCKIDQTQLGLLCDWPSFVFGGTPYTLNPRSWKFGSFMLEPRNSPKGIFLPRNAHYYGICPSARLVRKGGPLKIDIQKPFYAIADVENYYRHMIFKIGEHHSNKPVADLVDALYRYVGMLPDPPDEFAGFHEYSEEDSFAVFELNFKVSHDISRNGRAEENGKRN